MDQKNDDLIRERKKITNMIFESEDDLHELERFDERMSIFFQRNKNFFFEMGIMYSSGELKWLNADLIQELNCERKNFFSTIEDEKKLIKKRKRDLEDMESDLYYKQRKLNGEEK